MLARHKWLGAEESIDYFSRLCAVHGLLSATFKMMEKADSDDDPSKLMQEQHEQSVVSLLESQAPATPTTGVDSDDFLSLIHI